MADKTGRRASRNSKKEKGEFRKHKSEKTAYQKERDALKRRKGSNGNYSSVSTL